MRSDSLNDPKRCLPDGTLKCRRPLPHVYKADVLRSIVRNEQGKWVLCAPLNGWPVRARLLQGKGYSEYSKGKGHTEHCAYFGPCRRKPPHHCDTHSTAPIRSSGPCVVASHSELGLGRGLGWC